VVKLCRKSGINQSPFAFKKSQGDFFFDRFGLFANIADRGRRLGGNIFFNFKFLQNFKTEREKAPFLVLEVLITMLQVPKRSELFSINFKNIHKAFLNDNED